MITCLVIGFILMIVIFCGRKTVKEVPLNYILLFAFTFVWSWMVAGLVAYFKPESVLACAVLVCFMFIALTLFACCSKASTLNVCGAIGCVIGICLWPAIFFWWMFPSNLGYIALYLLITVLTCIYIVFDTRAICEQFDVDEYIIASLILYVDIIQLFMLVLSLCGSS